MPEKIRDPLKSFKDVRFTEILGAGKGSHRTLVYSKYPGAITVSGKLGDDANQYREKQAAHAIDMVQK
jgi:hypothetical protein